MDIESVWAVVAFPIYLLSWVSVAVIAGIYKFRLRLQRRVTEALVMAIEDGYEYWGRVGDGVRQAEATGLDLRAIWRPLKESDPKRLAKRNSLLMRVEGPLAAEVKRVTERPNV